MKDVKSIVFTVRLDLRTLAGLVRFYKDRDQVLTGRGSAVVLACEDLFEILRKRDLATAFESTEAALHYLQTALPGPIPVRSRAPLIRQIAKELEEGEDVEEIVTHEPDRRAKEIEERLKEAKDTDVST